MKTTIMIGLLMMIGYKANSQKSLSQQDEWIIEKFIRNNWMDELLKTEDDFVYNCSPLAFIFHYNVSKKKSNKERRTGEYVLEEFNCYYEGRKKYPNSFRIAYEIVKIQPKVEKIMISITADLIISLSTQQERDDMKSLVIKYLTAVEGYTENTIEFVDSKMKKGTNRYYSFQLLKAMPQNEDNHNKKYEGYLKEVCHHNPLFCKEYGMLDSFFEHIDIRTLK